MVTPLWDSAGIQCVNFNFEIEQSTCDLEVFNTELY